MSMKVAPLVLSALLLTACGGHKSSTPADRPGPFAVNVVTLITGNGYSRAWKDLASTDQKVAPLDEYVTCESRSPVLVAPSSVKVVGVTAESIGLGDGKFVNSSAVRVRMVFAGAGNVVTHTVHLVAEDGHWKWILPSWRFRDYRANKCPVDAASTPPPVQA
jgi:hypothetical protein